MNEWDLPTLALLEASRQISPPRDAKARVRRRLAATVAATAAGGTLAAASSPWLGAKLAAAVKAGCAVLPGAGATSVASTSALLVGPVVVGVALGLSAMSPTSVETPPHRAQTSAVAPAALRVAPRARVATPGVVPPVVESAKTDSVDSSRDPVRPAARSAPPVGDFAAQSELIERARVVLRQGDAELSLRALSDYRRLYPRGMFFVEAMTLEAQALCALGRLAEGQSRLQRLEATGTPSAALRAAKQKCAQGKEP